MSIVRTEKEVKIINGGETEIIVVMKILHLEGLRQQTIGREQEKEQYKK